MHLRVRTRLLLWLVAATLPIFGAGIIVVSEVQQRVSTRVERDLQNLLELEVARINSSLASQEIDAGALASLDILVEAIEELEATEPVNAGAVNRPADAANGPADAATGLLDDLAVALSDTSAIGTAADRRNTEDIRIVNREGSELGRSDGYSWEPFEPSIVARAMEERRVVFGNAFLSGVGDERMGLVVPIVSADGSVLGALQLENRLAPVVELLRQHEGFGETSEAIIVQYTPEGRAGLVTLRRFERDSAFRSTFVPDDRTPVGHSLIAGEPHVVRLVDYRGEQTVAAVQRIDATGWGLTVKIDTSEAYALSDVLSRYIQVAMALTVVVLGLGWLIQVQPMGRRLQQAADASARLAGGDYRLLIKDDTKDEIGALARRIDQMAGDLAADRRARQDVENQLRFQANHDTLTKLINRQRASALIDEFGPGDLFSLLFLDVDGFKYINDSYGHAVGDQVLAAVASRLAAALDESATWARWGGDEFLAILPGADEQAAADVSAKVGRLLGDPVVSKVGRHTIGASIGAATSGGGRSPGEVLHEADVAMFRSKRTRSAYEEISPVAMRLVDAALSDNRVEVAYQPVVRLDEMDRIHLHGAEALVRIRNEDGSVMSPAEFLPALGANDLAAALDTRVVQLALQSLRRWQHENTVSEHFRIAFNVGSASVSDPQLAERLSVMIRDSGVDPSQVMIEIPETVEVIDAVTLNALRALGVSLAIDDVGCQYSNLERMVDLNADVAKLDRRWIPDLATAGNSTSEVLRGLVSQCLALGLNVIAEGVETDEQLVMLRGLGIDVFQGYLFGRPVSSADFERNWRRSAVSTAASSPLD